MPAPLAFFSSVAVVLLRVVAGYLFAVHGAQKLFGVLGATSPVDLFSLLGAAGVIELAGGTMIALGLYTSLVAFVCSGEMAFAYVIRHVPMGTPLVPHMNGGELAVLYCFLFFFLASRDGGGLSLDRLFGRK